MAIDLEEFLEKKLLLLSRNGDAGTRWLGEIIGHRTIVPGKAMAGTRQCDAGGIFVARCGPAGLLLLRRFTLAVSPQHPEPFCAIRSQLALSLSFSEVSASVELGNLCLIFPGVVVRNSLSFSNRIADACRAMRRPCTLNTRSVLSEFYRA